MTILDLMDPEKKPIVSAVKHHAEQLLDHSPKFRYFTLHGKAHIESMLRTADLFLNLGISLCENEAYLLCLAICIHDLGMVVPLNQASYTEIFQGRPQIADPALIELFIRDVHHELVDSYVAEHFDFLTSLGLTPPECGLLKEIARSHRRISLSELTGYARNLGGLLRIIDEFDIGPARAPAEVLRNTYKDMDATSCWHWFKHNIVDTWSLGHNIQLITEKTAKTIRLELIVRPPEAKSIPYWRHQIMRPLRRVLFDEGAAGVIVEHWGIRIRVEHSDVSSKANPLGNEWEEIEQKAFSHGRKVILLIDDEVRKMEDLLIPLMHDFHIIFSPNAKDALTKIRATEINLAIIDMQIGSGRLWTPQETDNYKATGKKLCEEILKLSPKTKVGILTGTRYDLKSCAGLPLEFIMKKPVDPEEFESAINDIFK